ncbi:MAG: hypothetical protein GC136_08170 [Alphaproteobacteria bacterium]|nr:hypothetical protein [Alphaproteobacteria bacterium]
MAIATTEEQTVTRTARHIQAQLKEAAAYTTDDDKVALKMAAKTNWFAATRGVQSTKSALYGVIQGEIANPRGKKSLVHAALLALENIGVPKSETQEIVSQAIDGALAKAADKALSNFIHPILIKPETRDYISGEILQKSFDLALKTLPQFYMISIYGEAITQDPRTEIASVLFDVIRRNSSLFRQGDHPLEHLEKLRGPKQTNMFWHALDPADVAQSIVYDFTEYPMSAPTNIERLQKTFAVLAESEHLQHDLPNAVERLLKHHCTADDEGRTLLRIVEAAAQCTAVKNDLRRILNNVTCYVLGIKDDTNTSYEPLAQEDKIAALLCLDHVVKSSEHLDYKIFRDVCATNGVYTISDVRPHPAGTINSGEPMLQGVVFFKDGDAVAREGNVTYTRPLKDLIQHVYGEKSNVCSWTRTNFIETFLPQLDWLSDDSYGTAHKPEFAINAAKDALKHIQELGIVPKREIRQPQ